MNNAAELLRLIENLIRLGTVADVDHARARVRVKSRDLLTGWLPWADGRAGETRDWSPPTIGEQVLLFSPGGDTANGVALAGLFQSAHPAPSADPATVGRWYPDGAVIEYDHVSHHLSATLPGSAALDAQGAVSVTTPSTLTATAKSGATVNADTVFNGDVTLNGNVTQPSGKKATIAGDVAFTGGVTSNGKDISASHKHTGIKSGDSNTGGVA